MNNKYVTRCEMADILGLDRKTFMDKAKKAGIEIPKRERISPALQKEIMKKLSGEEDIAPK